MHPNDGDLTVRLDSPDGTRVALLSRVGASGDNFTGTIFDDSATKPIPTTSTSAPFTGTFMPREPLGQLIDQTVTGTWKLNINDQVAGNTVVRRILRVGRCAWVIMCLNPATSRETFLTVVRSHPAWWSRFQPELSCRESAKQPAAVATSRSMLA